MGTRPQQKGGKMKKKHYTMKNAILRLVLYVITDKTLQLIHVLCQMPKVYDLFISWGICKKLYTAH